MSIQTVLGRCPRVVLPAMMVVMGALASPALAQSNPTLFVTKTGSDSNPCTHAAPCATISHAVSVAASGATIGVGPGTYDENVTITAPLTINGAGAKSTTVYGNLAGSVFTVTAGPTALTNLTIGGGATSGYGGGVDFMASSLVRLTLDHDVIAFNSAVVGGGVFAGGASELVIDHTAIFGNQASGTDSFAAPSGKTVTAGGGGIETAAPLAEIFDSAIYQNSAGNGNPGGGVETDGNFAVLANDTIAENTAGYGGGVAFDSDESGISLLGDTIAGNNGDGVFIAGSQGAEDTIVALNNGGNCGGDHFTGTGHDLEDDAGASCGFSAANHDLVGVNPLLGPLQSNGGPTETMALAKGSPAIGAGDCSDLDGTLGADIDQRGDPRYSAQRGACDIGAWDSGGSSLEVVRPLSVPAGAVSDPYTFILNATKGVPPYTWSVASGALPAGLSITPAGTITGTPQARGTYKFTVEVSDSAARPHVAKLSLSLVVQPAPPPAVWVASVFNGALFVYPPGSSEANPTEVDGPNTQLADPDGLAVDQAGFAYVANASTPSVTVYAPIAPSGGSADPRPVRVLDGPDSGMFGPAGVALDTTRNLLYVANPGANTVTVYDAGATGEVTPLRTITGLDAPWGVTVDGSGDLWVANSGSNLLTEYPPGANGDAQPMTTIASPALSDPHGLGQATGALLVANNGGDDLLEFDTSQLAAGTNTLSPSATVSNGSSASLNAPQGVDVDAQGLIYVAGASGLSVFNPTANLAQVRTQGILDDAVAVAPPLSITTRRLPTAALGRPYRQRIGAVLGQRPLHWRLVHGKLPTGLKLTKDGLIQGTPTRLGTFRFTVAVRDSTRRHPMRDRQAITLTVRRMPTITAVHAASGPLHGGRRVTITGSGFATGRRRTTITFGRLNAIDVVCRTSTRCTARTPPHAAGAVRVTVTVDGLTATGGRATRYRYRR